MDNRHKLFRLLVKVDSDSDPLIRETQEVKEALARGMVVRQSDGLVVTEKGRQFVFQRKCADFLNSLQAGKSPTHSTSIVKWLGKHEFIVETKESGKWAITPRGRDWVSQLKY